MVVDHKFEGGFTTGSGLTGLARSVQMMEISNIRARSWPKYESFCPTHFMITSAPTSLYDDFVQRNGLDEGLREVST